MYKKTVLWIVVLLAIVLFGVVKIYFHQQYFNILFGIKNVNFAYFFFWMMGFLAFALTQVFILDMSSFIGRKIKKVDQHEHDRSKRDLFKLAGVGTISLTSSLIGEKQTEMANLKKVEVKHDKFPKELNGLKVGLLSDLHLGPIIKEEYAKKICKMLMDEKPDIIAITGDMADGRVRELKKAISPVLDLVAPYGVYMVTGNHEYYWNVEEWSKLYRENGITVLHNENRVIDIKGSSLMIAGVNDYGADRFHLTHISDPKAAVSSTVDSEFKILLAHRPRNCYEAAEVGFDLQVSGHTHGGQSYPFNLLVGLVQPYLKGLYKHKDMSLYITSGAGFWGPPIRLGVPAEVTIISLKADENSRA